MCGRFVVSYTYDELMHFLGETFQIFDLDLDINLPRYNIAPGQKVLAVLSDGEQYRAGTLKWGLVPHWAKDESIGFRMINARSETIDTKASFKEPLRSKRCVILADGFYEWKREGDKKRPMYIHLEGKKMFLFAGLWSTYRREDGSKLHTTTIITTEANELMSDLHDRMPVILTLDQAKEWLNPATTNTLRLKQLLWQYPSDKMAYYEVSPIVNSWKNDTPACVEPVEQANEVRS